MYMDRQHQHSNKSLAGLHGERFGGNHIKVVLNQIQWLLPKSSARQETE